MSTPERIVRPWSRDEMARLKRLKAEGLKWGPIGELLHRTGHSCENKFREIARVEALGREVGVSAAFKDGPAPRANDDELHLELIDLATNGAGFPVMPSRPHCRRAA